MADHTADHDDGCGGCRGVGAHRRHCPRHPDYHPWRRLADMAESIGDTIGGNDTGIANRAYSLAGAIRDAMPDHPYRTPQRDPSTGLLTL
jgi:hypothetical protein